MCKHPSRLRPHIAMLLASLIVLMAASTSAQETLHVYGPLGPSPAIREAAVVFGDRHNVTLDVVAGPTGDWRDKAVADADLIFASAEFMMSEFLRTAEFRLDAAGAIPLYMRPSAILVRPGNPKGIRDFPDLLQPGVRVMVVTGSGQTGLWEDMAGKLGDIRTIRALRQNIAVFAPDSADAKRIWSERADIDAWLTWSIWYMPLRDRAEQVPVSPQYRVHRQCSIAITERGRTKPLAKQFVAFLTSPEGAAIFDSWGWMTPPAGEIPLTVQNDICAVCRIDSDQWKDGIGLGLACVRQLIKDYGFIGIPPGEVHISAVLHGDAAYWMLKDEPYGVFAKKEGGNPNKAIVEELLSLGASIELCGQTMKERGWTKADVLPGVKVVAGAYPRIIDLELQGYAYIRF